MPSKGISEPFTSLSNRQKPDISRGFDTYTHIHTPYDGYDGPFLYYIFKARPKET